MKYIALEGGPHAGHEGPIDRNWLPSWIRVRRGGNGLNELLLSPGGQGGGELYVLASEGDVCVYHHWTIGAGLGVEWMSEVRDG